MTDLYLLYNKARGTELISPDDFCQAVQVTNSLSLEIEFKQFNSGVKVIQLKSFNSEEMCVKIVNIINNSTYYKINGIQAQTISELLNISITITKEVLLIAELKEYICRDDSIYGLSYFINNFINY